MLKAIKKYFKVPGADSSKNTLDRDVIGNKTDTSSGNSLVALVKQILGSVGNIPQDSGKIYYVDASQLDNSGDGLTPDTAKKTIGAGIGLLSTGEHLQIKAGTYTETGLDLNVSSCTMTFEPGVQLSPASGTCLVVSGSFCLLNCPDHSIKINPAANQTGVVVSGNFNYIRDIRVDAGSSANIGFDLTGSGGVLNNCRCANPLIAAFKIQNKFKLEDCCTGGTPADTSIGYWVTNNASKVRVDNCGSQGNATAGYQVDAGCTNVVVRNCSTGGGDGRKIDNGTNTVFANFTPNEHEELFPGRVWYVDGAEGSDTGNDGLSPGTALATIGTALTACSNGDMIKIRAGNYDENGLDVANNGVQLIGELGVQISDTTTGTQTLLVSGDHCLVEYVHVEQAGQVGFKVTGAKCALRWCQSQASTTGFDIDGNGTVILYCASSGHSVAGFDVSATGCLMQTLASIGSSGATKGYVVSGDYNVLDQATSVANGTRGFELSSGAAGNSILNCSSGASDGPWLDTDSANFWDGWSFDNVVYKTLTFNGSGAASANLFKVTGTVQILKIYGHVRTVLSADIGNGYLNAYDGTNTVDVTNSVGPSFNSLAVDSFFVRSQDSTEDIVVLNADQVRIDENSNFRDTVAAFAVNQKNGADTFIRFTYSDTGTSGEIHWHVEWVPVTDGSFVEPA
jgi:hypothetical protein